MMMNLLTSREKYEIHTTGLGKRLVNVFQEHLSISLVLQDGKISQSVFFISYLCDHKKPRE